MWVLIPKELKVAPTEEAPALKILPKYSEIVPIYTYKEWLYVKVDEKNGGGGKGWIKALGVTYQKPDLFKPLAYLETSIWGEKNKLYVADDTKIAGVFLNGKALLNFKKAKKCN